MLKAGQYPDSALAWAGKKGCNIYDVRETGRMGEQREKERDTFTLPGRQQSSKNDNLVEERMRLTRVALCSCVCVRICVCIEEGGKGMRPGWCSDRGQGLLYCTSREISSGWLMRTVCD